MRGGSWTRVLGVAALKGADRSFPGVGLGRMSREQLDQPTRVGWNRRSCLGQLAFISAAGGPFGVCP